MSKPVHPAIRFAVREMYKLLNEHSDYTYSKIGELPTTLRIHLQRHPEVELVRQITDLDGVQTSLFRHTDSSAWIYLRQFTSRGLHHQAESYGEVTITAMTHDDLLQAIFECDRDGAFLDELLGCSDDD